MLATSAVEQSRCCAARPSISAGSRQWLRLRLTGVKQRSNRGGQKHVACGAQPQQDVEGVQQGVLNRIPLVVAGASVASAAHSALSLAGAFTAALAASKACLDASTVLFLGYSTSWLVFSRQPSVATHPIVRGLNRSRKLWCSALQGTHALALIAAASAFAVGKGEAAQLAGSLSLIGPLTLAAVVSVAVVGSVELVRKPTSKAVALQLDQEGPGAAHPIMVQGAQSTAKSYLWIYLMLLHGFLGIKHGCLVSLVLLGLLVAGALLTLWAGERDL